MASVEAPIRHLEALLKVSREKLSHVTVSFVYKLPAMTDLGVIHRVGSTANARKRESREWKSVAPEDAVCEFALREREAILLERKSGDSGRRSLF